MVTPLAAGRVLRRAASATPIDIGELAGDAVLVLAPHPDDETLGCGGAIAAACLAGKRVVVAAVTDGRQSHPRSRRFPGDALAELRRRELETAVWLLTDGAAEVVWLGYPDQAAPAGATALDAAVNRLGAHIGLDAITTVWSSWRHDPHVDHHRTAALADRLVALLPSLDLWEYPIWGRFIEPVDMDRAARLFAFDTTAQRQRKRLALAAHRSQMSGLIDDDPNGFVMTPLMQAHFLDTPELFIRAGPHV
jgi:LmbE family N-acetylglucosaminyl deacetylase